MKVFKKISSILLATFISIFPISTSLSSFSTVHALSAWGKITDAEFSDTAYSVNNSLVYNGEYYFTAGKYNSGNVYKYDGELLQKLTEDNFGDSDNQDIVGLVEIDGIIYSASKYNLTDVGSQVYAYNGDNWTNITDGFNEGDGGEIASGNIKALASYEGSLYASVERNGVAQVYKFASDVWTQVNSDGFGSESNTYPQDNMLISANGKLYIGITNNSNLYVLAYNGETWDYVSEFDTFPENYFFGAFEVYQGALYVTAGMYQDGGHIYRYNGETSWTDIADESWDQTTMDNIYALHSFGDYLYAGFSNNISPTSIKRYNGSVWQDVSDFAGDEDQSYILNLNDYQDKLMVSTALPGEGPYSPSVWTFVPPLTDYDNDEIPDVQEDEAPNGGDANNDEIPDGAQMNVTSFVNPVTSNYVVLDSTCDSNSEVTMGAETGIENQDGAFTYPAGLMDFTLNCGGVGSTQTVTMYFYGEYNASLMVARKYNPTTHTYAVIPGAVLTNVTIGGQAALKIVYSITDGGPLDADGLPNGVIEDPAGPALNIAGVPNTGIGRMGR